MLNECLRRAGSKTFHIVQLICAFCLSNAHTISQAMNKLTLKFRNIYWQPIEWSLWGKLAVFKWKGKDLERKLYHKIVNFLLKVKSYSKENMLQLSADHHPSLCSCVYAGGLLFDHCFINILEPRYRLKKVATPVV